MENRNDLVVAVCATQASGTAERAAAAAMMRERDAYRGAALGADKAYDTADFVAEMRRQGVTPHVAHNNKRRWSVGCSPSNRRPTTLSECPCSGRTRYERVSGRESARYQDSAANSDDESDKIVEFGHSIAHPCWWDGCWNSEVRRFSAAC
ncbi:MAG TPA: hypothetical protein PK677_15850 [Acidiphilium sp.]|nr:hypothetical protein [Acidiphilium sp.]